MNRLKKNFKYKSPEIKYGSVHKWLRYHYGKAYHCEGERCRGKSQHFEWCLKKGYKYEFNPDNFIQLCRSCHNIYDNKYVPPPNRKMAKLKWTQVNEIKIRLKYGESATSISKDFPEVTRSTIYKIKNGHQWQVK